MVNEDLDKVDWAILSSLEADARQSFSQISERVHLSKTPCWNRIQKLERLGCITGYRATLEGAALGVGLTAFIEVSVDFTKRELFEEAVIGSPAIVACYSTAGDCDYLLHAIVADTSKLERLLSEHVSRLPGLTRLLTTIVLRTIKAGGSVVEAARSSTTDASHRG